MPQFTASDGIQAPTLAGFPRAETVGSTGRSEMMRERIPDVELVSLGDMPHNICDALPHRCGAELVRFLDACFGDRVGGRGR